MRNVLQARATQATRHGRQSLKSICRWTQGIGHGDNIYTRTTHHQAWRHHTATTEEMMV
jgi:hypothetical protein